MRTAPRLPILVLLVSALIAGLVVDREAPGTAAPVFGTAEPFVMPVAPTDELLGAVWYCPGGPAPGDGTITTTLTLLNTSTSPATGSLVVYPAAGTPASRPVALDAGSRVDVDLAQIAPGAYVGAVVEVTGAVVVEQTVSTGTQRAPMPCARDASAQWYSATATTTVDTRATLLLLNPFPDDAVLEVTAATNEGARSPTPLQGFVVPGRSLRFVELTEQFPRKTDVALSIVARTGRVVAGRIQSFDGSAGRSGLYTTLLAPSTGTAWWFAEGQKEPGITERVIVANPGDREAAVDVDVRVLAGLGGPVEPLAVTVPAQSYTVLDVSGDAIVPQGQHALFVTAAGDQPIVVERVLDYGADSGRSGATATLGARLTSTRWVFAAGGTDEATEEHLVFANPGAETATVRVALIASSQSEVPHGVLPVFGAIEVEPGQRIAIRLNDAFLGDPASFEVTATVPIVAERVRINIGTLGASATMGVPFA